MDFVQVFEMIDYVIGRIPDAYHRREARRAAVMFVSRVLGGILVPPSSSLRLCLLRLRDKLLEVSDARYSPVSEYDNMLAAVHRSAGEWAVLFQVVMDSLHPSMDQVKFIKMEGTGPIVARKETASVTGVCQTGYDPYCCTQKRGILPLQVVPLKRLREDLPKVDMASTVSTFCEELTRSSDNNVVTPVGEDVPLNEAEDNTSYDI